ncbi:hypothetical protein P168DRAFT_121557 [Aspergillus campestris IBT 28561]|uniref:Uncharacterized protein n=1 Tax=Aspergillus campestris (strain IBT 28561) TaxID=1392248 RepID=A0A2I1D658_ASPC2|nr:uncharacterized protein P168DRAFT_121557 [Aspergillus campestris IBT 28561]PKY05343.1 hypothetical protein P168DRAFT_121557 [Aspergillus campestris IBT 28561]
MERLITWRGKKLELSYVNYLPRIYLTLRCSTYPNTARAPIPRLGPDTSAHLFFFVSVTTILIIVALLADFQEIYLSAK